MCETIMKYVAQKLIHAMYKIRYGPKLYGYAVQYKASKRKKILIRIAGQKYLTSSFAASC
jgi:hypothetical protein